MKAPTIRTRPTASRWARLWVLVGVSALTVGACDLSPTENSKPVADAGEDRSVYVGSSVQLDGSRSSASDGNVLTYHWTLAQKPDSSAAALSGASTVSPSLVPDVPGTYRIELTVSNANGSDADEVVITAEWDLRLPETISGDTILYDRGKPYTVATSMTLRGAVVIQPGVTIELANGAGIWIVGEGSLSAVGTAADSIRFIGSQSSAGWHRGIHFRTSAAANALKYVIVAHGGYHDIGNGRDSNVNIWNGGSATVTNSSFHAGTRYGVAVEPEGELVAFASNTFSDFGEGALWIYPDHIGSLDAASVYGQNSRISVFDGTATRTSTWPKTDAPYEMYADVVVAGAITMQPGARFKFRQGGIQVVGEGSLNAVGTASDTIKFTGVENTGGSWTGIAIRTNQLANQLTYVEVANAGGITGGVEIYGMAGITHSLLRGSPRYGLYVHGRGQLSRFSNNEFRGNMSPLGLDAQQIGQLDSASIYAGGNADDRITVWGGLTTADDTWPRTDGGYVVRGIIFILSAITVQHGARFEFTEGGIAVSEPGTLTAMGTALSPIVFTGAQPVPGHWSGIEFRSANTSNILAHVEVAYGGQAWGNVVVWDGGSATVIDSEIHHSGTYGMRKSYAGFLTESGNYFHNNASGDVFFETQSPAYDQWVDGSRRR